MTTKHKKEMWEMRKEREKIKIQPSGLTCLVCLFNLLLCNNARLVL